MFEPITVSLITQSLATSQIISSIIGGWLGNRSDVLLCKTGEVIYERLKNQIEPPVNHDIQRAVREAYLKATLMACKTLLYKKYNWIDRRFHLPTYDLKEIISYLKKQLKELKTAQFIAQANPADEVYRFLLQPKGQPAQERVLELKQQLRESVLHEFEEANLCAEDDLKRAIRTGWTDDDKSVDWYELLCAFFTEDLKTNSRLSTIIQTDLLLELKAKVPEITLSVGQLTELANQISLAMQPLAERFDEVMLRLDELLDLLIQFGNQLGTVQTGVEQSNESLEQLHKKVDRLQPATPTRSKYLNRFPHYDLTNFVGREGELSDIKQQFEHHRLLILQGMGGIGKSTLARAYISRNAEQYAHIAFVEVVDTIAQAMLSQLGTSTDVPFTYDANQTAEENFLGLLEVLRHVPNVLLVLDNANNPTDLLARKEVLESLHATVLVTSRARPDRFVLAHQLIPVKALPKPDALQLFTKLYGRPLLPGETTLVEAILHKAFYHPKLIEVIVIQIRRNDLLTLDAVKTIVDKKRYGDDEINYPDEADEQAKTIYSILLDLFNTDSLPEGQKQLLRYFAVLPAVDIPIQHLRDLLNLTTPDDQRALTSQLKKLALTAWLDNPGAGYFSIHGLVQWVVLEKLKPTYDNCENLLDATTRLFYQVGNTNPLDAQPYLIYGDELLTVFQEDQNGPVTILYSNISTIYWALGENRKALEYDLKALVIREAVLPATHPDLASSYSNIAVSYGALGENKKRLEYDLKALAIREAVLPANHPDLALSYNNIAVTYYYNEDLDRALTYMHRAVTLREQVLPANHPDLLSSRESLIFLEKAVQKRNNTAD